MNESIHGEKTASEPQDRSSSVAHSIEVPSAIIRKWQEFVNLVAQIIHVPSAAIMRIDPPHIKVFVSSTSEGNPCEPGALDIGPYCETVMKTGQPLLVADALENEDLISGRLNRTDLTPPEWHERDARTDAELKMTGAVQPFEKRAVARLPACISEAAHLFRRNSTGYESYGEATCPTSSAMARQCADSNSFLLNSPEETSGGALRFNRTCVRHAVRLNYQGSWNGLISARNDQASRGCWTRWNTSSAIDAGWQKKSSRAFGRRCRCQGTSIAASITR